MKIWFWVYFSFVLLIILYWLKRLATKKKLGSTTSGCLGFVSLYFFIFHGLAKIGIKESLQATDISIICITFSLSIIFIISFLFHIDTGDNKKKEPKKGKEKVIANDKDKVLNGLKKAIILILVQIL